MITKSNFSVILFTFCFFAILFVTIPTKSQTARSYDPWLDLNDDGLINMRDVQIEILNFGTSGIPINKTELLLDLQNRMNKTETKLEQTKTLRFLEPNETIVNSTFFTTAAIFNWTPSHPLDNAILSLNLYYEYKCESFGTNFRLIVNGETGLSYGPFVSSTYTWSKTWTDYQQPNDLTLRPFLDPDQSSYIIEFQINNVDSNYPAYVRNINVIITAVDGLAPS